MYDFVVSYKIINKEINSKRNKSRYTDCYIITFKNYISSGL